MTRGNVPRGRRVSGPVAHHGYGVGYQIHDDVMPINITSFKSNPDTSSARMIEGVEASLLQIREVMNAAD